MKQMQCICCRLSSSARSTQTVSVTFANDAVKKPEMKETACETDVQVAPSSSPPSPPTPKQVRHRAINTEQRMAEDQETNTRPRGVNISLTFGGGEVVEDVVNNYLNAITDIENSGQEEAFAAMDNLTRARLRRKMKERCNTFDIPDNALPPTHERTPQHRRFSALSRH